MEGSIVYFPKKKNLKTKKLARTTPGLSMISKYLIILICTIILIIDLLKIFLIIIVKKRRRKNTKFILASC